jgi:hypothetical protein
MIWTKEDGEDQKSAAKKCREVAELLDADAGSRKARWQTRRALDAAMAALLALDDVYFADDAGQPVPEAWARARHLLRKA